MITKKSGVTINNCKGGCMNLQYWMAPIPWVTKGNGLVVWGRD